MFAVVMSTTVFNVRNSVFSSLAFVLAPWWCVILQLRNLHRGRCYGICSTVVTGFLLLLLVFNVQSVVYINSCNQ